MTEQIKYIPARLKSAVKGGHVTGAEDIDAGDGKTQQQVNNEVDDTLALHQSEINALDSQNYVTVETYASLPATGEADTIYRVSSYDGTQVDATKYAEYAWNGSAYVLLDVKTQVGEVFDISQYKAVGGTLAKFADLAAALDGGDNVPEGIRKGGMSVKFVQSSDNKYVQYRLTSNSFSINIDNWQGFNTQTVEEIEDDEELIVTDDNDEELVSITKQRTSVKNLLVNDKNVLEEIDKKQDAFEKINDTSDAQEIIVKNNNDEVVAKIDEYGNYYGNGYRLNNGKTITGDKTTMYVSKTGNDSNDGLSTQTAKLTITGALNSGADNIVVSDGEYHEAINTSSINGREILIRSDVNASVIINNSTLLADDTCETVTGYSNVKKLTLATAPISDWLYQHLVSDERTLIPQDEIHPLQRGFTYRCDCTTIGKLSNITSIEDAIQTIDTNAATGRYNYVYDDVNSILYFSSPQQPSSEHPLVSPSNVHGFYNENKTNSIKLIGLNFYYGNCEFKDCDNIEVINCSSKYNYSNGSFRWDNCRNIIFVKCEAARTRTLNGDGFNGANSVFSKLLPFYSTVKLIDCWAHDNYDDGYSDHEGCEAEVWGGLYEYNGKAGVTPSYGSHCVCYNVISRKNINGFYYTGSLRAPEKGLNGNALFMSCLASNNANAGFNVDGEGLTEVKNNVVCVNCYADNNSIGYKSQSTMKLINSYANNNTTTKTGDVDISNYTLVE